MMVGLSWRNGFKVWKSNIKFLSAAAIIFTALDFGIELSSRQFNYQPNILMDFNGITANALLVSFLSSLIHNAINLLIIFKFNKISINKKILSKRIFLCLIIITVVDNLLLIYKPIPNRVVVILISLGFCYIKILLFLFPYLIIRTKASIIDGLKQSINYIKGNIFSFILFLFSFIILAIIFVLILIKTNYYSIYEIKPNFFITLGRLALTIIYYFVYSFYLSAAFAFAENVISQNENKDNDHLEENESYCEIENKTEEEINNEILFKELNPDIANFEFEQRVQNQYDTYKRLDYKQFIFENKIDDISNFNIIEFIMTTDLYVCLKEDPKIQKYFKKVFSYVVIDISGYDKCDVKCNYSDYFKENNNNFTVEITIYKGYSGYDITISLTINGEPLF